MESHISMLEKFAISQPRINAIYQGHHPEDENHKIYYLLINSAYDSELSDAVSDLDIRIANETKETCDLQEWPISLEQTDKYPFLKECIWKRD